MFNIGVLAGVSVAVLWTFTTLFFTAAGKRIGPSMVNAVRLIVALVLHAIVHRYLNGFWIPQVESGPILYFALSALLGLTIGDQCILQAFLTIGPRRALLVMTTSPLMAALFGWFVLDEKLTGWSLVGISLTIGGVGWVIRERTTDPELNKPAHGTSGYVLALAASLCQAAGLMLSKQGMGYGTITWATHVPPQSATLVRMAFAVLGMIPILLYHAFRRRESRDARAGSTGSVSSARLVGALLASCGAITGPFFGVWLSLISASIIPIGVAQTLLSLTPIMIIPIAKWCYHEHISPRALFGTLLAVAGVGLLFVRG
jgi:drug/metabolite transporter (DMT)-like permease